MMEALTIYKTQYMYNTSNLTRESLDVSDK